MIRALPNRNGREFLTFYIGASSGTDLAQWDWGITVLVAQLHLSMTILCRDSVHCLTSVLLALYMPLSMSGYFVYGDNVNANILQTLSEGWMRTTVEILITLHLIMAFVIALNPFTQEFEEFFNVPNSMYN